MIEFFQTGMGHKFYEHDVPEIARALSKIAKHLETSKQDVLEALNDVVENIPRQTDDQPWWDDGLAKAIKSAKTILTANGY